MNANNTKTVVVGLSGGVDSSVAAFLLKQQGYRVIGVFMKNWEEEDDNGSCLASKDYADVVKVCQAIDIPYYSVNFAKEYKEDVFSQFLKDYADGFTPNPDILCNQKIKFNLFLKKALNEINADFLATGHYCQNILSNDNTYQLSKATDLNKDQTYFLYTVNQSILSKVLFPLGHLTKPQVRQIALDNNIPTHNKKDSTGICFIGKRDFTPFLQKFLGYKEGIIKTIDGEIIGHHCGYAYYTIGQRKGLGIGGKGDAWFVADKDIKNNIVIVAQGQNHPSLFTDTLIATDLSWVSAPPRSFPFSCHSKVRYRQPDQECVITKIEDNKAYVSFAKPQRAVTQKQSIVFYHKDTCIGGGVIEKTGSSYHDSGKSLNL
jgi:tRNA-uridine 2-sulfurtransferase